MWGSGNTRETNQRLTLTCVMRVSFSMGLKDLFDAVEVRADAAALPNADMVKFLGDVKAIMDTDGITPVLRVAWKLRGHAGPYQLWHGKVQGGFRDPLRVCFDEDSGVAYPLPNNALQYAKLDVVANPLPLAEIDEEEESGPPAELAVQPNVWEVDTWHGAIEGLHGGKDGRNLAHTNRANEHQLCCRYFLSWWF